MTLNLKYCKPINDGKNIEFAPSYLLPNTLDPTEEDYNEAGWYKNAINIPNPPNGLAIFSTTYKYDEETNSIIAVYKYSIPKQLIRVFSKLKLYNALSNAGLWNKFEDWLKTWMVNEMNAYTAFSLALNLNDQNELFMNGVEKAKHDLLISDEIVKTILEESISDDD